MKTLTLKLVMLPAILLVLTGSFFACKDKKTTIENKWKLTEVETPFTPDGSKLYDYSQYDITYEFKKKGILTISGNKIIIEPYLGHEIGTHTYTIDGHELKINNNSYNYKIYSTKLVLDASALDGYIYHFVKF